jgi:hypothetical protein
MRPLLSIEQRLSVVGDIAISNTDQIVNHYGRKVNNIAGFRKAAVVRKSRFRKKRKFMLNTSTARELKIRFQIDRLCFKGGRIC